jgi:hypothetical protein
MVSGFFDASSMVSSIVVDEQSRFEEASSSASTIGSVYSDESSRSLWVPDFSDLSASVLSVDSGPGSISV